MRQEVVATLPVARQESWAQRPEGVWHIASRLRRSYRLRSSSSSPLPGARLALGTGATRGRGVSSGVSVDTQGPDLRGAALGLVRREDAHRAVRSGPQGRYGDGDPAAGAGDAPPRLPPDAPGLDGHARARPARRVPATHASRLGGSVPGRRLRGLRCRRQTARIAPDAVQRASVRARCDAPGPPAAAPGPVAVGSRPAGPPGEDQQPPDVADGDVPRRHRVALALEVRALRQQRTRPPAPGDRRPAERGVGHRRCGIGWIPVREGAVGQRPAPRDPGRSQRAPAEGPGLRAGEERPGLSLAGSRGGAEPSASSRPSSAASCAAMRP